MQGYGRWIALGLVLSGLGALLWWQSAAEAPKAAEVQGEERKRADDLEGAGTKPPTGETEAEREEIASAGSAGEAGQMATDAERGSLLLRVIYAADKSPAVDLGVRVRESRKYGVRPRFRTFRTDARGEVRVSPLRPGKVVVVTDLDLMGYEVPVIEAGKETEFVYELKDGITLNGIVVDKDGVPVPRAEIVCCEWAGRDARTIARANQEGRFHLREVSKVLNVGARAPGHAPSPMRTIMAGEGAEVDIRIVLPGAGGSVRGVVVDDAGRGVRGAEVKVGFLGRATRVITLPDGSRGHVALAATTKTDGEGRFDVAGFAPGETPVQVRADGFAPHLENVAVAAHVPTSVTIRLRRGATCVGTVRDGKGEPIGGVEVSHAEYDSPNRRSTRTERDGTYRLTGLPAGLLEFFVRTDEQGNASTKIQARPGETIRWDVKLSRGLVIEGLVTDEKGTPIDEAMIEAVGPFVDGRSTWFKFAQTDANGKFELIDVPRDTTLEISVQAREHRPLQRQKVKTTSGPLNFKLKHLGKPTARIVGMLVDPDGNPVASAQVSAHHATVGGGGLRPTKKDGRILIERLHAGRYTVRVRAGAFPSWASQPFDLAAGATHDLGRVELVRGGHIRVELTRPKPESRFYFSVYESDGKTWVGAQISTTTDPMRSEPVAPGSYVVRVIGKTIVQQDHPITVRAGEETIVEIAVREGVPCELEFDLPADLPDRRWIDVTVTGEGFAAKYRAHKHRDEVYRVSVGLPVGRFQLKAVTEVGYTGSRSFEVQADDKPQKIETKLK